jgi:hypothetical protein
MFGRLISPLPIIAILAIPTLASAQDTPPAPATSSNTPSSNTPTPSASQPAANPPKKVFTNDDVSGSKSGISVVGDKRNLNYHQSPDKPADPATIDRIKKNLQKLQDQLDDVNAKLKTYKQFQDGDAISKGDRDMSKAYSRTPVDQQMTQLLDKKAQLETQIGDLFDEARKKGIDPGQLRQ